MILQALKDYYDRKPDLPREGWEMKAIPFLVLINVNGKFVGFQDTREGEGKKLRAKEFLVPCLGEKKGNGIKANLFWENIEYVFGIPVPTENKPTPNVERVQDQHATFARRIDSIPGECYVLKSVRNFLGNLDRELVQHDPNWHMVLKLNQVVLLAIAGYGPVTDDPDLRGLIDASLKPQKKSGLCLITGNTDEIVALEPPIRGVRDANPMGASLVAVNNEINKCFNAGQTPAFASFMKKKGGNSPIGKTASFAYTTALNHLLRKDSRQRIQIGDATTVFWSAKTSQFENEAYLFFGELPKDDPDMNTEAIKALYATIWNGSYQVPQDTSLFFVLGLAPNAARISVRFWSVGTVSEIGYRLQRHISDLAIDHRKLNPSLPLRLLLKAIAAQEEEKNIPPNLAGDTMRSILEGTSYPQTLLQAAIRRIRAEHQVTYARAALIKASLNRSLRFNNPTNEKELTMSLDTTNINIGYRLGRLFAALEKIQADAQGNPNASIRDRFYGAASGTPATVFGTLMRMKNHHLAKLPDGLRITRERQLGEIISGIQDFPAHLQLVDQGRFAIGYYHQNLDFFTKKTDKE